MFVVCYAGSCFCDQLITGLEESYCVCVCVCLIVCDRETSTERGPRPKLSCCTTENKYH